MNWCVQAWCDGRGYVDCGYYAGKADADDHANRLDADPAAWVGGVIGRTRVVPIEGARAYVADNGGPS